MPSTRSRPRSPRSASSHPRRTCASSATRSPSRPGTTYTASAVVMPETVEEVQAVVRIANEHRIPLWTSRPGPQQRLRRPRAAGAGLGHRQPAAHEPRARDRRGVRIRGRRARRALVRPLRGDPGRRPPAHALDRRSRLGQRRRQHARPRRHLHARTAPTCPRSAAWRSCSRTARSCAPGWARCPATGPGTSTSAASARRPTSSSCSRTSGS